MKDKISKKHVMRLEYGSVPGGSSLIVEVAQEGPLKRLLVDCQYAEGESKMGYPIVLWLTEEEARVLAGALKEGL